MEARVDWVERVRVQGICNGSASLRRHDVDSGLDYEVWKHMPASRRFCPVPVGEPQGRGRGGIAVSLLPCWESVGSLCGVGNEQLLDIKLVNRVDEAPKIDLPRKAQGRVDANSRRGSRRACSNPDCCCSGFHQRRSNSPLVSHGCLPLSSALSKFLVEARKTYPQSESTKGNHSD